MIGPASSHTAIPVVAPESSWKWLRACTKSFRTPSCSFGIFTSVVHALSILYPTFPTRFPAPPLDPAIPGRATPTPRSPHVAAPPTNHQTIYLPYVPGLCSATTSPSALLLALIIKLILSLAYTTTILEQLTSTFLRTILLMLRLSARRINSSLGRSSLPDRNHSKEWWEGDGHQGNPTH